MIVTDNARKVENDSQKFGCRDPLYNNSNI